MTGWLITGGAGYIGSHVAHSVIQSGHEAFILDDFSTGIREAVPEEATVLTGSILDRECVYDALCSNSITGVIHLAALKSVARSFDESDLYYRTNVVGTTNVLHAMRAAEVQKILFSSSAAVYGDARTQPIVENSPKRPLSPYGDSKLKAERAISKFAHEYGFQWVALRYFNVAGARQSAIGDTAFDNVIPRVFRALDSDMRPVIFGNDYPTPDGTCIRDYLHVEDLAEAHTETLQLLDTLSPGEGKAYNVGRNTGVSVRELMDAISQCLGYDIRPVIKERRHGDPPVLVADASALEQDLGWRATRDLEEIVSSAKEAWDISRSAQPPALPHNHS